MVHDENVSSSRRAIAYPSAAHAGINKLTLLGKDMATRRVMQRQLPVATWLGRNRQCILEPAL
jgi:hypothetical protein